MILYRNESYSCSGERSAVIVMTYEIFELRNTDILRYCLEHYQLKEFNLRNTLSLLIDIIENDEEIEESDVAQIVRQLVCAVSLETHVDIRYVLWLASKDSVIEFYGGSPDSLDKYESGPVILSDLGPDGILFGYPEKPEPLNDGIKNTDRSVQQFLEEICEYALIQAKVLSTTKSGT